VDLEAARRGGGYERVESRIGHKGQPAFLRSVGVWRRKLRATRTQCTVEHNFDATNRQHSTAKSDLGPTLERAGQERILCRGHDVHTDKERPALGEPSIHVDFA